jgi:hypothetical protein
MEAVMHPTIAYQLVQERIADLHRQTGSETLSRAATGAWSTRVSTRRPGSGRAGRPRSQTSTGPKLASSQLVTKPVDTLGRLAGALFGLASFSRRPSRLHRVTNGDRSFSSDGPVVPLVGASVTPMSHPSTSGSRPPAGPAHRAEWPERALCVARVHVGDHRD